MYILADFNIVGTQRVNIIYLPGRPWVVDLVAFELASKSSSMVVVTENDPFKCQQF